MSGEPKILFLHVHQEVFIHMLHSSHDPSFRIHSLHPHLKFEERVRGEGIHNVRQGCRYYR